MHVRISEITHSYPTGLQPKALTEVEIYFYISNKHADTNTKVAPAVSDRFCKNNLSTEIFALNL